MNILYLTNELNYADGVSSHLYNLIKGLKRDFKINISIVCGGGDATDKFRDMDSNIIEYKNLKHSSRSLKNFATSILFLHDFTKKNKIDIFHSHNHYAANIAHRCSKFSGTATVQTIHGIIPDTGRLKHLAGNNFIAVNDHVLKSVKIGLHPGKRVDLIYNGIDFNENIIKNKNAKLKFIAASRFEPGKGLETFIEAVGKLNPDYRSRAEFIIAGEGTLERDLKKINHSVKADISFPGKIKNLRDHLTGTDIFVITSESEGFPMTVLEAASSMNSIISSDFNGIEDILTNNKEGVIFKMNDADELSGKIKFAIDNPDIMKKYSEAFFQKAKSKFNISDMSKKHFSLYKSLL